MDVARWIIGGLLIGFSLYVAISQIVCIVAATRRLRADPDAGGYSVVPSFGGLLGAAGAFVVPNSDVQRLWWIPLIIDPGCILLFGCMAVFGIGYLIRRMTGPPT